MSFSNSGRRQSWWLTTTRCTSVLMASLLCVAPALAGSGGPAASVFTTSPIKHVIILVGENRGFDHTFAT